MSASTTWVRQQGRLVRKETSIFPTAHTNDNFIRTAQDHPVLAPKPPRNGQAEWIHILVVKKEEPSDTPSPTTRHLPLPVSDQVPKADPDSSLVSQPNGYGIVNQHLPGFGAEAALFPAWTSLPSEPYAVSFCHADERLAVRHSLVFLRASRLLISLDTTRSKDQAMLDLFHRIPWYWRSLVDVWSTPDHPWEYMITIATAAFYAGHASHCILPRIQMHLMQLTAKADIRFDYGVEWPDKPVSIEYPRGAVPPLKNLFTQQHYGVDLSRWDAPQPALRLSVL